MCHRSHLLSASRLMSTSVWLYLDTATVGGCIYHTQL
nr:MAG TPA: hypothetical protein [Caudoviricetes sp.]